MGLCYLLTLYCAIRSYHSSHRRWWYAAAIAACIGGALSKQVIATVPIVVLVYDGLFLYPSLPEALRKRWGFYTGLAATTWGILIATTLAAPVNETAGFAVQTITPLAYLKSQPAVMLYYLRLAIWPDSLCLDYDWKQAETLGDILPYAIVIMVLLAATLWALWRRQAIAFLGVWFFLILSLTSSFMPFDDLIFEHRMYLSLAAVVGLLVLVGYDFGKRLLSRLLSDEEERARSGRLAAMVVMTLIVTLLSLLTVRRNVDYKSQVVMWNDVVNKRPLNPRGHNNLGTALLEQGLVEDAYLHFTEACKYKPNYADGENNLGQVLIKLGKVEEGKTHLLEALRINPKHELANYNMGLYLASRGQLDEAIAHFSQALQSNPFDPDSYTEMGMVFERQGKLQEAMERYTRALQVNPQAVKALSHLALILATHTNPAIRNTAVAQQLAAQAVYLTQNRNAFSLHVLALIYAETGRYSEAIETAQIATQAAKEGGNKELLPTLEAQLKLYREGHTRLEEKSEKTR
jgi:tetratricopeptide (TPR) repeat protein